jgi:hypothetical protein
MPAKYARHFIKITAVRCERLRQISDEDCIREGIKYSRENTPEGMSSFPYYTNGLRKKRGSAKYNQMQYDTPQQAYAALIDSIHGKGTWEQNPYVWVYVFKLVQSIQSDLATERAKQYGDLTAFPTEHLKLCGFSGISRREYFAGLAITGLATANNAEYFAGNAVKLADALLEELSKT